MVKDSRGLVVATSILDYWISDTVTYRIRISDDSESHRRQTQTRRLRRIQGTTEMVQIATGDGIGRSQQHGNMGFSRT
jgi:hypothetical protein